MTGYPAWPELFRWLTVLKDRVEQLPSISAEQVITGTLDPSVIPPIPWDLVLKAGSSLGDLETRSAGDLSSGTLLDARMPALTGDVSSVAGTVATTLATVNLSPGSYGSGTLVPIVTVNEKGLVTDVMTQPIVLVPGGYTVGDLLYANSLTTLAELHDVSAGSYLRSGGVATAPVWSTLKLPNAVTAGSVVFASATNTYGQDNANLFWDDANNWMGIGTATPSRVLELVDVSGWDQLTVRENTTSPRAFFGSRSGATLFALWSLNESAKTGLFDDTAKASAGITFNAAANDSAIRFSTSSVSNVSFIERARFDSLGRFGVGVTSPTAFMHIKAGTATANTAPLKFNSGTLLTTAEAGAVEFLTDAFYGTITTGAARKQFLFTDGLITGLTGTLGVANGGTGTATTFTIGSVVFAGASGVYTQDNSNFFWDDTGNQLGIGISSPQAKLDIVSLNLAVNTGQGNFNLRVSDAFAADIGSQIMFKSKVNAVPDYGNQASIAGRRSVATSGDRSGYLQFSTSSPNGTVNEAMRITASTNAAVTGSVGIGVTVPTAVLHLKAGIATANYAPLKFTSGTNLTTAEAGAMEYDGTDLFFTRAGTVRENVLVAIDNVAAPTTSIGAAIVNFYGANATNFLGDPNRWLSVNVLGSTYKIPLYT